MQKTALNIEMTIKNRKNHFVELYKVVFTSHFSTSQQ